MPERVDTHDVFISHSHVDTPFCLELAAGLRALGVSVWLDEDSMTLSDTIPGNVGRQITHCVLFVVVLSHAAQSSPWVKLETETAIMLHKNLVVVRVAQIDQLPDWLSLVSAYKHFSIWETPLADCIRHIAGLFPDAGASVQKSEAQWQAHTGPALDANWSPDGRSIATVGADGALRVWRQPTPGKWSAQDVMDHNRDWLTRVRWSQDGAKIAAIGVDNSLWIWQSNVGRHKRIELPHGGVLGLGWSRTRVELVTTGGRATCETQDEGQLHLGPPSRCPIIATISLSAASVASYFDDRQLLLADGERQRTITLDLDIVYALAWNQAGTAVALLASEGRIRIFGIGREVADRSLDTTCKRMARIAWVSDDLLLTGDTSGVLRAYRLSAGQEESELGEGPGPVSALSVAPDARLVAVTHETGMLSLWRVDTLDA